MHDKNKDRKKFYITVEMSFKWIFLTILITAIFRTQSKVGGGAFLQKYLTTFSC